MMAISSKKTLLRPYVWLGLKPYAELVAVPPKGNNDLKTHVWHTNNPDHFIAFVERFHETHTLLYGKNPRPRILKNKNGHARSALEKEIEIAKNIVIDFDFLNLGTRRIATRLKRDKKFAKLADDYFGDLGLASPVRAYTGQGYHWLFAHPPIRTGEFPDLADRVAKFISDFEQDLHKEIAEHELKIDRTHHLQGHLRVYGTAKPDIGIISEFYGDERKEDPELADLLLSMPSNSSQPVAEPDYGPSLVKVFGLPNVIKTLIQCDEKLNDYWHGRGKPNGHDTSPSGYDYSLARRLMILGVRNVDTLASAIANRPGSSIHDKPQPEDYLRRTIAAAIIGKYPKAS